MKKQIVFVHGGQAYGDHDAFLEHLRTTDVSDPLIPRPKRWKDSLGEELGDSFEVFMPRMPNSDNAKYEEWKIWFERHFQFLRDAVILVGHSQGGYFLLKYLSENSMPVRVAALYLLAAPVGPDDFDGEDGGDFAFDHKRVSHIIERAGKILIFHSKDDPVVPFSHAEKLKELLPAASLIVFEEKGHFLEESFPELINEIKK